jgi:phage/plasmid primase-like uncharacterized protein
MGRMTPTPAKIITGINWKRIKSVVVSADERGVDQEFIDKRTLGSPFATTIHLTAALVGYVIVGQFSSWNVSQMNENMSLEF